MKASFIFVALFHAAFSEELKFRFHLDAVPTQCFIEFMGDGTEGKQSLTTLTTFFPAQPLSK